MPGEVPEGWEDVTYSEIAKFSGGTGFPDRYQGATDGDIPFIKVSDMNSDGNEKFIVHSNNWVSTNTLKDIKGKIFPKGAIAFPKVGAALLTNKRRILSRDTAVDNNIMVALAKRCDENFLYYSLCSLDLATLVQKGAVPSVNQAGVGAVQIALPPLPEQQKIAKILTSVDDAIQATEAVIEQTKKVKQGVMNRLLTKGIGHTRFKQTGIGEIPEGWEVVAIGELLESSQYGINQSLSLELPGVPVLRMGNIQDFRLDLADLKYAELPPDSADRYLVRRNDILFNRTNSLDLVGKVAIVDTDHALSFSSYIVRLRALPGRSDPVWLFCSLSSARQQTRLRALATPGVSQANINPTKMRQLLLPVPPVEEQKEIATAALRFDDAVATARQRLGALVAVKRSLMSDLLTGRMRVNA